MIISTFSFRYISPLVFPPFFFLSCSHSWWIFSFCSLIFSLASDSIYFTSLYKQNQAWYEPIQEPVALKTEDTALVFTYCFGWRFYIWKFTELKLRIEHITFYSLFYKKLLNIIADIAYFSHQYFRLLMRNKLKLFFPLQIAHIYFKPRTSITQIWPKNMPPIHYPFSGDGYWLAMCVCSGC